jgi:hypothetical protein
MNHCLAPPDGVNLILLAALAFPDPWFIMAPHFRGSNCRIKKVFASFFPIGLCRWTRADGFLPSHFSPSKGADGVLGQGEKETDSEPRIAATQRREGDFEDAIVIAHWCQETAHKRKAWVPLYQAP